MTDIMDILDEVNVNYVHSQHLMYTRQDIDSAGEDQENNYSPSPPHSEGEPYLKISENPQSRGFRFRYMCEGTSHGGLQGEESRRDRKTFPSIKIMNYSGPARITVTLVTDEELPKPHAHELIGKDCKNGVCVIDLKNGQKEAVFSNLGIRHVTKKRVVDLLTERIIESIKSDKLGELMNSGHRIHLDDVDITADEKSQAREQADEQSKNMQLNVVRLCFQAALRDLDGMFFRTLPSVMSCPIYDSKSPGAAALKICRMDKHAGCCVGNNEVFLLCDKVQKDDIAVRFYEEEEGQIKWEDFGSFGAQDVHRQYAIVFRTPAYRDTQISSPAYVQVQLKRMSDNEFSEPKQFTYYPQQKDQEEIKKKRKKQIPCFGPNHGNLFLPTTQTTLPPGGYPTTLGLDGHGNGNGGQFIASHQQPTGQYLPNPQPATQFITNQTPGMPNLPVTVVMMQPTTTTIQPQAMVSPYQQFQSGGLDPTAGQFQSRGPSPATTTAASTTNPAPLQSRGCSPLKPSTLGNVPSSTTGLPRNVECDACPDAELRIPFFGSPALPTSPDLDRFKKHEPSWSGVTEKHEIEDLKSESIFKMQSFNSAELKPKQAEPVITQSSQEHVQSTSPIEIQAVPTAPDVLPPTISPPAQSEVRTEHQHLSQRQPQASHRLAWQITNRLALAMQDFAMTGDATSLLYVQRHLVSHQDDNGDNALHMAVIHSQVDAMVDMLTVANTLPTNPAINMFNSLRQTPVHLAVCLNQPEMVELLADSGALVGLPDWHGNTPIHLAAKYGFNECLQQLLTKGSSTRATDKKPLPEVDYLNYDGLSALHLATQKGDLRCVKSLVAQGLAKVNVPDGRSGRTPLHHAVERESLAIVGYLILEGGAHCNQPAFDGVTPLHIATGQNMLGCAALLISAGADPDAESIQSYEDFDDNDEDDEEEAAMEETVNDKDAGTEKGNDEGAGAGAESGGSDEGYDEREALRAGCSPRDLAAHNEKMLRLLNGEAYTAVQESYTSLPDEITDDLDPMMEYASNIYDTGLGSMDNKGDLHLLDPVARNKLARLLDVSSAQQDWKEVACKLSLHTLVAPLEFLKSPTRALLDNFEALDGTLAQLREVFGSMSRPDLVQVLDESRQLTQTDVTAASTQLGDQGVSLKQHYDSAIESGIASMTMKT